MTANERYEKAWDSFLVYLNRNPKAQLTPFLKERHVNHRTMMNWMCEKGYSVLRAKKEIRQTESKRLRVYTIVVFSFIRTFAPSF